MLEFGTSGLLTTEEAAGLPYTDMQQVSLSFWYYRGSADSEGAIGSIHDSEDDRGWWLLLQDGTFFFLAGRSSLSFTAISDTGTTIDTLEHWVVTWDGTVASAAGTEFYLDGVAQGASLIFSGSGARVRGNPEPMFIDLGATDASDECAHVAVWERVLYPTEVLALYRRESPLSFPDRLRGYWVCDHGVGVEPDLSGNRNMVATGSLTRTFRDTYTKAPYPGLEWAGFDAAAAAATYEQVSFRFRNDDGGLGAP